MECSSPANLEEEKKEDEKVRVDLMVGELSDDVDGDDIDDDNAVTPTAIGDSEQIMPAARDRASRPKKQSPIKKYRTQSSSPPKVHIR